MWFPLVMQTFRAYLGRNQSLLYCSLWPSSDVHKTISSLTQEMRTFVIFQILTEKEQSITCSWLHRKSTEYLFTMYLVTWVHDVTMYSQTCMTTGQTLQDRSDHGYHGCRVLKQLPVHSWRTIGCEALILVLINLTRHTLFICVIPEICRLHKSRMSVVQMSKHTSLTAVTGLTLVL